jgi:hypothetical protein
MGLFGYQEGLGPGDSGIRDRRKNGSHDDSPKTRDVLGFKEGSSVDIHSQVQKGLLKKDANEFFNRQACWRQLTIINLLSGEHS